MSSYITVDEADTYFSTKLNTATWDTATTAEKTKALAEATARINRLNFYSDKYLASQDNEFPRGTNASVPTNILDACAEIAIKLLDGFDEDEEIAKLYNTAESWGSMRIVRREFSPDYISAGIPSVVAWRLLLPYLRDPKSVRMYRC